MGGSRLIEVAATAGLTVQRGEGMGSHERVLTARTSTDATVCYWQVNISLLLSIWSTVRRMPLSNGSGQSWRNSHSKNEY